MNLDLALVSAILTEGRAAYDRAVARGIAPEKLQGEGATAFAFLREYLKDNQRSWPTADLLVGKTNILVDVPDNSADFFIKEVLNRNLYITLQDGVETAVNHLRKIKPEDAFRSLETLVSNVRAEQAVSSQVESVFKLGPQIKDFYERIKNGERGIQTPWPSVNDATYGFWPEDLVLFVARIGVGKTWTAILTALHAWRSPVPGTDEHCRVLFITTEVSQMRVGMRLYAAMERLPYGEFTHGRLTFLQEERLFKLIDDNFERDGFFITGGDFDFRMESVQQAIEHCNPNIVVVDGAYLLQAEGDSRTERMAATFNEMKRMAKRKHVPIVITTQLNRGAAKKGDADSVELDNIALSDVGGWNADLVFALIQSDEQREQRQMAFKPLKVREGAGKPFVVNWDFDRMDFSELTAAGGGGGDSDEKGLPSGDPGPDDPIDGGDVPF
jgi:replicative DNA helicase